MATNTSTDTLTEINLNDIIDEEQAKKMLEAAELELSKTSEKVKQLKTRLKYIQALKTSADLSKKTKEKTPNYEFELKKDKINELCEKRKHISGLNDLFRQVLSIKKEVEIEDKNGNISTAFIDVDYKDIQISERIKKQGLDLIESYCVLHKESPRVFRIKSVNRVDFITLNRDVKLSEKEATIAKNNRMIEQYGNKPKVNKE